MKITVTDILPFSKNDYEIFFNTMVGNGKAVFTTNNSNAKIGFPKIGKYYNVEFTVNFLFNDIFQSNSAEKYEIYHQDNTVF